MIHSAPEKIPFRPQSLYEIRDCHGRYLGATDWLPAVDRYVLVHHDQGPFLLSCRRGPTADQAWELIRTGQDFALRVDRWIIWWEPETGAVRTCSPDQFPGLLPDWLAGPLRRAAARRMEVDLG